MGRRVRTARGGRRVARRRARVVRAAGERERGAAAEQQRGDERDQRPQTGPALARWRWRWRGWRARAVWAGSASAGLVTGRGAVTVGARPRSGRSRPWGAPPPSRAWSARRRRPGSRSPGEAGRAPRRRSVAGPWAPWRASASRARSSAGGMFGFRSIAGLGATRTCWCMTAAATSAMNGGSPVSISYRTHPSE